MLEYLHGYMETTRDFLLLQLKKGGVAKAKGEGEKKKEVYV
jgi:hypothetical protein